RVAQLVLVAGLRIAGHPGRAAQPVLRRPGPQALTLRPQLKDSPMRKLLLATVGTSLFRPNLEGLRTRLTAGTLPDSQQPLARAYADRDWTTVAAHLAELPPSERLCGAEINSIASLIQHGHVAPDTGLFFFHSATDDGRAIAAILQAYYR